ncbi:GNAT family N-acetyltransferase [Nocardia sp. NPDC048505]|uniref:GNAT family N-acetyltransferase n=1 Tax=Nocardia sp. NPDC048505 TaxID=3155756 RepID=UPI0033F4273D
MPDRPLDHRITPQRVGGDSARPRTCVWLNGGFGSGKSTLAAALVAADPRWRILDPEHIGFMLAAQLPERALADFQDLASWRRLVPTVVDLLATETGQNLLIVQTVLNKQHWHEITKGIRAHGYSIHHVLLDADPETLDARITADRDLPQAAAWRHDHIPAYLDARRDWLTTAADLVLDTTSATPAQLAAQLADALETWNSRPPTTAPILTDPDSGIVLRGHRAADIPAIIEQCHDPAMLKYTRIPRPYTTEDAHQLLDLAREGWAQPSPTSPRFWAITVPSHDGHAFAGTIDYRPTGHHTAVVGYGLHPAFRGAGVMAVALRLVADYAFGRDGQHLLNWQAQVGNWASAKTARRNGFRFEGQVRGLCLRPDGSASDGWIATLHRDDPRTPTQPWPGITERPPSRNRAVPARGGARLAWFGTSLMQHLEAHNPRLTDPTQRPKIGERVEVTEHRRRGYVHALLTTWRARYPWIEISSDNLAHGGATSRDILATIRAATVDPGHRWDLVFLGAGINDVWRTHQRRTGEAVGIEEFDANLRAALHILRERARQIVVIGEPPMGWQPDIDVTAANTDLHAYNQRAQRAAADAGAHYVEVFDEIAYAATCLGWSATTPTPAAAGAASVWSDGVHLGEHGDELMRALIDRHLSERHLLDTLLDDIATAPGSR